MMPNFYRPPLGLPLYWGDEQSGRLPNAVRHYFNVCIGQSPAITPPELELVVDYCTYFINAPCWEENLRECEEMLAELMELRTRSKTLASVESIRRWNEECMDIGLDPF